jgi:hypothetical protein
MVMEKLLTPYVTKITRDLEGTTLLDPSLAIFHYLVDLKDRNVDHIPFSRFQKIVTAKVKSDNEEILKAAQYFCGESVHLLDVRFEYIDESDEAIPLSTEDALTAINSSDFSHPYTGLKVENSLDSIFMFFAASSELKQLD